MRDKAAEHRGAFYMYQGIEPVTLSGTGGVRAFIFGPPEDENLIADEDPRGDEAFPRDHSFSFSEAVRGDTADRVSPFRREFAVPLGEAFVHGGTPHASPGAFPGSEQHTICLHSLSKAFGFASWRIGFVILPVALDAPFRAIQDTWLICPPVASQLAGLGCLQSPSNKY